MQPISPLSLTDDRLLLRVPTLDDVPAIAQACQDPEVQRWTTIPSPYAEKDAIWFVDTFVPERWANGTAATWVVTDRQDGRLLGTYGLDLVSEGLGEVGFWMAREARGAGVCTAATRLVCRWGFEVVKLRRIEWQAFVGNAASRRVSEKVGFSFEGTCRARLLQRGDARDGWLASLLPGELT